MHIIQFKIEDSYLQTLMTILKNLKLDIKDLVVTQENKSHQQSDTQKKLQQARGILRHRIPDPVSYQRKLRNEWERD